MKPGKCVMFLSAVSFCGAAGAVDFSFTGSFVQDDNVQLFNFAVASSSTVTLRTWSYAGGTNAAGADIARGGFDPILALFDGAGVFIDENDDGPSGTVATDLSGAAFDTYLSVVLDAGAYTVSVTQYDNFATGPNLANGFDRAGDGNFTAAFGCGAPQFCDLSGSSAYSQRDGHWAFDILNVNTALVVPEPETYALLLAGLGLLGFAARRRKAA
jgi:PEP-CTERM motif-containing protein